MHRNGSVWKWPTNPDKIFYEYANILREIKSPKQPAIAVNLC